MRLVKVRDVFSVMPKVQLIEGQGPISACEPIRVDGKFLAAGARRFWVRGITYGAFAPAADGREYTNDLQITRDFAQIATLGFNTVRIPHTVPPLSLLDIAERHGLRVIAGLSAEQGAGYLIDGGLPDTFLQAFRDKVRQVAAHPALLCLALGNEIPSPQVRWLGHRRVEQYLHRFYKIVKEEAPTALVTYVNYPTTEYLDLSFLDLVAFNVYLEKPRDFAAYLSRLQHIAGDRPLLLTELGLDSMRNGEELQAATLRWQIRETFAAGAAGAVIFSWTDDWCRGREPVNDWAFGITDRERNPKLAAGVVRTAFVEAPFPREFDWPRASVVICTFNGSRTIRECLSSLTGLDYPNYEVIIVNDGSTDGTGDVVAKFPYRAITQPNSGLSMARNVGLRASTGEIVAYIDDDTAVDRHWLHFLALAFLQSSHAAIGGPNLPPQDGFTAAAVARAPGNPCHVMLSDDVAEHIPGCNMAFRRDKLVEIGGFDPQFRIAGDDVDICWRLQQAGETIGFAPAAVVWHRRRNSVREFWRQQVGYGKAESLLAAKWPEKYNLIGHIKWSGQIYGACPRLPWLFAERIYHGVWGLAPFQSLHRPADPNRLFIAAATPEWQFFVATFSAVSLLGVFWKPLWLISIPALVCALALPIVEAAMNATKAPIRTSCSNAKRAGLWTATFLLSMMQPVARLYGRLRHGLTPWRARWDYRFSRPWTTSVAFWSETHRAPEQWLSRLRDSLLHAGGTAVNGGAYDRWDLEIRAGIFGGARLLMAVEDHGSGNQYVRALIRPHVSWVVVIGFLVLILCDTATAFDRAWPMTAGLSLIAGVILARSVFELGAAVGALGKGFCHLSGREWNDGQCQSCK
jgi:GT2 family glycosyltransferase